MNDPQWCAWPKKKKKKGGGERRERERGGEREVCRKKRGGVIERGGYRERRRGEGRERERERERGLQKGRGEVVEMCTERGGGGRDLQKKKGGEV